MQGAGFPTLPIYFSPEMLWGEGGLWASPPARPSITSISLGLCLVQVGEASLAARFGGGSCTLPGRDLDTQEMAVGLPCSASGADAGKLEEMEKMLWEAHAEKSRLVESQVSRKWRGGGSTYHS